MKTRWDLYFAEREKAEVVGNLLVLREPCNRPGYPVKIKIWRGKQSKPFHNYCFPSKEAREKFLTNQLEQEKEIVEIKEKRKQDRRGSLELLAKVEVGSIFHWSWGYDQTNCNFFEVIEKNGRALILREIGQQAVPESTYSHGMADMRLAEKDKFLSDKKPFKKILQFLEGRPYISMEYGWCDLWDEKPQYCSWYA